MTSPFHAAVFHPGIAQRRRPDLILTDVTRDQVSYEQRMCAQQDRLTYLALHPCDRLIKDRNAVEASEIGRPFNVMSTFVAGFENFTNVRVSSGDQRFTLKEPPSVINLWVTAVMSTPMPMSTGSMES